MKRFDEKNSGLLMSIDFKNRHIRIGYWIMVAFVALCAAICLLPTIWVFLSSFKDMNEFLSVPPTIIPHSFHPEKLGEVWKTYKMGMFYKNTVVMALGELISCVVINGLSGYVISRLKPKGATLFYTLVLWTLMMPSSMSTVPLFMTFIEFPIFKFNTLNTYFPMWMMAGANAFNVMLFKNFFDSIPSSYVEAARLDGCSDLNIFSKIIVPLSKPIIMVVTIFSLNGSWESFFWPYLVLKDTNKFTVAVEIFKIKSAGMSMDKYMIMLLFTIIPPMLVFIFLQRYMMEGITMTGVKG